MRMASRLWIGIAVLILLSPLGLFLPERFQAGSAWGEWGAEEMQALVGYVPRGLERIASLWSAPMPDYAFRGWEEKGLPALSFAYIMSAIIGIGLIALLGWLTGKFWIKSDG